LAKKIVDDLRPGLTLLILHPAQDTPELRALASDWRCRVANYEACMSEELRDHVRESGVQLIGYRPLSELIRSIVYCMCQTEPGQLYSWDGLEGAAAGYPLGAKPPSQQPL
jgi:hypothetical protein